MTDAGQPNTGAPFAPAPPARPSKVVVVIKKFPRALHKAMSLLAWVFPFIMLAVGYWFPQLRTAVTWPWSAPAEIWGPLFLIFAITSVWLAFELYYATHRDTSVRQLQADDMISLFGALILTLVAGGLIRGNEIEWWYLIPWGGSIIDAAMSGFLAINNAAQKPFFNNQASS